MCNIATCERCSMYDVRHVFNIKCLCALPNADNTKKKKLLERVFIPGIEAETKNKYTHAIEAATD